MIAQDFIKKTSFKSKVFVLNGEDDYFKYTARKLIQDGLKIPLTYVDTSEKPTAFYTKIDSFDLIPEPKLFYLNNADEDLSKQKFFWNYVKESPKDSRYIINTLKMKEVPEGVDVLEVECEKIKDSAREVAKFVTEMFTHAMLVVDPKDLGYFYYLYRNDLFAIFNEIQKCKLWAKEKGRVSITYSDMQNILSPISRGDVFGFANNFIQRRLSLSLKEIEDLTDNDVLPYSFNLFKAAEKILAYKSAVRAGLSEDEIIKGLEINMYYLKYTLKTIESMWKERELKNLLIALENINFKIKSFNFPCAKAIVTLTLKYCNR